MPVTDHIDNAIRFETFTPTASAGPFALPFPIYEADSAAELESDFLIALDGVIQTAYSVSGTFTDGVAINGAVTMDAPVTGTLIIYSRRRPRSSVDLANGQAVTSLELQAIVNGMLASVRDVYDWMTSLEAANVLPAGTFVPTAGGGMTGFLDLNADPTTALKAATKQYVDGKLTSTTKGDLIGHTGAASARVAVGSDGKALRADSTDAEGLSYSRNKGTLQTLTDAANISWNMDLGDDAKVTLAANRTLNAPSNEVVGQYGYLDVIQDATGGRTLTWNAAYKFPLATDEKPDPTIGATTRYHYEVRGTADIIVKKVWQSASNSIGFYKEYDKGAYAVSTPYTQAHGLGRQPAHVAVFLENTTTEANWAVGDRVLFASSSASGAAAASSLTVGVNTTTLYLATGPALPAMNNRTTGASASIVAANWKVIFRVYE